MRLQQKKRAGLGAVVLFIGAVAVSPAASEGFTYTDERPAVLVESQRDRLAISAEPDRALYRADALPQVTVRSAAEPGARLVWRVRDGFDATLLDGAKDAAEPQTVRIVLPPGHGYYEIVVSLQRGGRKIGEMRRSIGALTPPPRPVGDEPFGLWIRGSKLYPELGVRWTREGIYWRSYKAQGEEYLAKRIKHFEERYRAHGIRIVAYPKHPHPNQTSREVIEDTPEAWKELEEWWTTMVRSLAGHVDAWGAVNEPTGSSWKGDNKLIMRYWALMRRIVDRYDPGTPLLGPSLNSGKKDQMAQYGELLKMGFAKYIDVVEMHTYTEDPVADWWTETLRVAEMTRRSTDRKLPIWSTEHGYTASYKEELKQARRLMLSGLEAKRIGYPVMIWHMFGTPYGTDRREVEFAIFRETRGYKAPPQPRPAGLAFGVMTRQLVGATYERRMKGLDPSVRAYVFSRDGHKMVAVWSGDGSGVKVTLPVSDGERPTVTGLFGRVETPEVRDGRITVTPQRDPVFIAPLPVSLD